MISKPILTLLLIASVGCARNGIVTPIYDEATRVLLRLDYDYDANGTVDVRTYIRNGQPFRLEGDTNGDGVADRWEYYDASGHLERVGGSTLGDGHEDSWAYTTGDDLRLELSTARDGFVDRREYYHAKVLVRTESDTNHDGRPDLWEEYEGGRVTAVLVDDDKTHGKPTRRVLYGGGGAPRIEIDPSGDGHFAPVTAAPALTGQKEHAHVAR